MPTLLTESQSHAVCAIAGRVAQRILRSVGGRQSDREDLRQDLLLDLLQRLRFYDSDRGSLACFASTCFQHRAHRLEARIRRERGLRDPVSLDEPLPSRAGLTFGQTLAMSEGYCAWMGQPTDDFGAVELRLDLDRALGSFSEQQIQHCAALAGDERGATLGPRTSAFRRVRELRMRLLLAGIPAPV